MIINLFYIFAGSILMLLNVIFSMFDFIIPDFVSDTLTYFFQFFTYFRPFMPIDVILSDAAYFIQFLIVWYSLKLLFFLFKLLPFTPKNAKINISNE